MISRPPLAAACREASRDVRWVVSSAFDASSTAPSAIAAIAMDTMMAINSAAPRRHRSALSRCVIGSGPFTLTG